MKRSLRALVKVTFDFNADDTEDANKLERMVKVDDLCAVLWDFSSYLRQLMKYGFESKERNENKPEALAEDVSEEIIEKINDKFYELMNEHDIDLDKIWT